MAQDFSKSFYNSSAWKECRKNYIRSMPFYYRGLCERCYANGEHVIGEEVHHKIWLTPDNINNPSVTLSFNNLELLCHECHTREHLDLKEERRYEFDMYGNLVETK